MRNNAGDFVRLLLFIIAISFMKMVSVPHAAVNTERPKQEIKPVGRGADTTTDKKLVATQKIAPRLSDL